MKNKLSFVMQKLCVEFHLFKEGLTLWKSFLFDFLAEKNDEKWFRKNIFEIIPCTKSWTTALDRSLRYWFVFENPFLLRIKNFAQLSKIKKEISK